MVYIEARIDIDRSSDNIIPHITARRRLIRCGEFAGGREGESLFHERKITALFRAFVDRHHEGIVQCEDVRVVVQGRYGRY